MVLMNDMEQAEVDLIEIQVLPLVETVLFITMQVDIIKIVRHLRAVMQWPIRGLVVAAVVKPLQQIIRYGEEMVVQDSW